MQASFLFHTSTILFDSATNVGLSSAKISAEQSARGERGEEAFIRRASGAGGLVADLQSQALPLFLHWGSWHNEITRKRDAIRPITWILATVPELRVRALLGPGLDAMIVDRVRRAPATAMTLSRLLGSTYAAVHESAARLEGRGLLSRTQAGRRQYLHVADAAWSYFGFTRPSSSMLAPSRT